MAKTKCSQAYYYVLSVISVYLYIFAPPFQVMPIGVDKVFLLISYIYIVKNNLLREIYKHFNKEFFILSIICLISILCFLIFRIDTLFINDILLTIECIPCSFAFYHYFAKKRVSRLDDVVVISAIFASLITFYLVLNPDVAIYLKQNILKFPENLIEKFFYRGYGFSDGLMFSYPVIMGFSISFILLKAVRIKKYLYYISIFFMFIAVATNARSGFVPALVALILLFILKTKYFTKILIVASIAICAVLGMVTILIEDNPILNVSINWAASSLDILSDFFEGEKSENLNALLGNMIVWPETVDQWLIGSGRNIFMGYDVNSDIGYFIRLNYGGVIYMMFWFVLWLYMFVRLYKVNRGIAMLMFVSLLYLNYKSDFFIVNPGSRYFFLVYVLSIINKTNFVNILNKK